MTNANRIRWVSLAMLALLATGCSHITPSASAPNWEQLTAATSVAKVSNISHLIQPGFN